MAIFDISLVVSNRNAVANVDLTSCCIFIYLDFIEGLRNVLCRTVECLYFGHVSCFIRIEYSLSANTWLHAFALYISGVKLS
jgi:hypothetical protein